MSRTFPFPISCPIPIHRFGLAAVLAATLASPAAAGGYGVGFGAPVFAGPATLRAPATTVSPPLHPASPNLAQTFIHPAVPPVQFAPLAPGLLVVPPPPAVIVTSGPVIVHSAGAGLVAVPPMVGVHPTPPAIAPSASLHFAPAVRVFAPAPVGGPVIVIRRGH